MSVTLDYIRVRERVIHLFIVTKLNRTRVPFFFFFFLGLPARHVADEFLYFFVICAARSRKRGLFVFKTFVNF